MSFQSRHRLWLAPLALVLTASLALLAACGADSVTSTSTSTASTIEGTASTATTALPLTTVPTATTVSPATTTPPATIGEACSAAGLDLGLFPQLGLPGEVEKTRRTLFEEAASCDFDALEAFAKAAGGVSYTFGAGEEGPAAYWRAGEKNGDPVSATLVKILNMPYGRADGNYVWPFAHALDFAQLTDEQMQLLRQYFTEDDIQDWIEFGGYIGYRVGIGEDGKWLYFVAGD